MHVSKVTYIGDGIRADFQVLRLYHKFMIIVSVKEIPLEPIHRHKVIIAHLKCLF